MDYSNFIYNINSNSIIDNKMNRINTFKDAINNIDNSSDSLEKIDSIIKTCESVADYASLIDTIPANNVNLIMQLLSILNVLALNMAKKYTEDLNSYNILKSKFNEFENLIFDNKDNPKVVTSMNMKYVNNIGNILCTLDRVNKGVTTDYIYYIDPITKYSISSTLHSSAMMEGIQNIDDDACRSNTIIKHESYIMDLLNETDVDSYIAKMDEIYNFLVSIDGNYTDHNCEIFSVLLGKSLDMIINSTTGKEKLLSILDKCDNLITNTSSNFEDNANILISYIEDVTTALMENPQGETSLMFEMGLGYMYNIIPSSDKVFDGSINSVVEKLNETAQSTDMVSILNESIKDYAKSRVDKAKERFKRRQKIRDNLNEKKDNEKEELFDATKDTRIDIDSKRQSDNYDREESRRQTKTDIQNTNDSDKYGRKEQKRQDAYDRDNSKKQTVADLKNQNKIDKYNLKQQKRQDKVDFKNQKRLDKWEQKKSDHENALELKEQKRQERLEARQRRRDETKIGLDRWKTLELTNVNARKAADAVRKSVKCVAAAGAGALLGVNPILAGAMYLIRSFVKDVKQPKEARRKLIDDMKQEQITLEDKINQAEANGETDKKRALMKMKYKIDQTIKRCSMTDRFEADM